MRSASAGREDRGALGERAPIVIGTGSHRAATPGEIAALVGPGIAARFDQWQAQLLALVLLRARVGVYSESWLST